MPSAVTAVVGQAHNSTVPSVGSTKYEFGRPVTEVCFGEVMGSDVLGETVTEKLIGSCATDPQVDKLKVVDAEVLVEDTTAGLHRQLKTWQSVLT